jgi:RNA polymerase sigma-70 factor (ECF subfamily)
MFDDQHIITRVKAGDQQAFGMLIARYQRLVGAMVFRMVRDPLDREEISQDVFIRAYRSLHHFRGDAKFSTWLGRIAYNQCITYLKRKRIPLYEDLLQGGSDEDGMEADRWASLGTSEDNPVESLQADQASQLLKKAVDELPGQYGVVLAMFHLEELSVKEIGEMMEMPEGTVKNYLFRARKLLKEKLEKSIWRQA